jgi:plasmid stability protein
MVGPILQLRAANFDKSKQAAMRKLLEQIVVREDERADYVDFHFKKGKTLGLNLKEYSC